MKFKLIIIILLLFSLLSCGIKEKSNDEIVIDKNNNEEEVDLSKYYSDSCPEGQIMSSRKRYRDGRLEVLSCTVPFSCPEGKKLRGACGDLLTHVSCSLVCGGEDFVYP